MNNKIQQKEVITPDMEEKKFEETNVIDFNTIKSGGKVPPGTDWLMQMNINSTFLIQDANNPTMDLIECTLLRKKEGAAWIAIAMQGPTGERMEILKWAVSNRFSNKYKLYTVLDDGVQIDA